MEAAEGGEAKVGGEGVRAAEGPPAVEEKVEAAGAAEASATETEVERTASERPVAAVAKLVV